MSTLSRHLFATFSAGEDRAHAQTIKAAPSLSRSLLLPPLLLLHLRARRVCTSSHYFGVFKKKIRQKYARGGSCSGETKERALCLHYLLYSSDSQRHISSRPPTRSLLLLRMMYGRTPELTMRLKQNVCLHARTFLRNKRLSLHAVSILFFDCTLMHQLAAITQGLVCKRKCRIRQGCQSQYFLGHLPAIVFLPFCVDPERHAIVKKQAPRDTLKDKTRHRTQHKLYIYSSCSIKIYIKIQVRALMYLSLFSTSLFMPYAYYISVCVL